MRNDLGTNAPLGILPSPSGFLFALPHVVLRPYYVWRPIWEAFEYVGPLIPVLSLYESKRRSSDFNHDLRARWRQRTVSSSLFFRTQHSLVNREEIA